MTSQACRKAIPSGMNSVNGAQSRRLLCELCYACYTQVLSEDCQCMIQDKAAAASIPAPPARTTGKLYLTPKTLPELLGVLEQYATQQEDFRVIAGNTGAGVYHDWPSERVLVDIKGIPDLARIETSKVRCVLIVVTHVWLGTDGSLRFRVTADSPDALLNIRGHLHLHMTVKHLHMTVKHLHMTLKHLHVRVKHLHMTLKHLHVRVSIYI